MRSWKHSRGTEYFRSALEYFVASEMIRFLQSGEYASALKAMTVTGTTSGTTSFVKDVLTIDSGGIGALRCCRLPGEANRRGVTDPTLISKKIWLTDA